MGVLGGCVVISRVEIKWPAEGSMSTASLPEPLLYFGQVHADLAYDTWLSPLPGAALKVAGDLVHPLS